MKSPVELARQGQVKEAFDSILDQEVPVSALALSPTELAKRGMVAAAYSAILGCSDQGCSGSCGSACSCQSPTELAKQGRSKEAFEAILAAEPKIRKLP